MDKIDKLIEKKLSEGATTFVTSGEGSNVAKAFQNAVDNARHAQGHEGYTGTVAEKDSYIEVDLPPEIKDHSAFNDWITK